VVGAVGVVSATREAALVGARAASTGHTLLRLRAGRVEAGAQTLAVNADAGVATLEVELAAEGRWVGFFFEGVEAESVVRAGRPNRAFVFVGAFTDAAEGGADCPHRTVGVGDTQGPLRRRLGIALVPLA